MTDQIIYVPDRRPEDNKHTTFTSQFAADIYRKILDARAEAEGKLPCYIVSMEMGKWVVKHVRKGIVEIEDWFIPLSKGYRWGVTGWKTDV